MATDADLLMASLQGETQAFAKLVERHQSAVCAVSYANTGNSALSEDVAQDAFVAAWRSLHTLREPGRFKSWVCGIARNLASKARRSSARLAPQSDVADTQPTAEQTLDAAQRETAVWEALESLSDTYREPLVLFYRDGRSTKEVAEALALTVATVEQRLSRGRKQLREEMAARVEETLASHRPTKKLSARVVAAIHAGGIPVGTTTPPAGAPSSPAPTTPGGISMKTALFGLAAAGALGLGGYGAYTTTSSRPSARSTAASARTQQTDPKTEEANPAKVRGADARRQQEHRRELGARADERTPQPTEAEGGTPTKTTAAEPFQIKQLAPRRVGVKLAGGMTGVAAPLSWDDATAPKPIGTRRGQVVDEHGTPVAGAVVVSGESLSLLLEETLTGQDAAVTDAQGFFTLPVYADENPYVFAAHHTAGMAPFEQVAPSGDSPGDNSGDDWVLQLQPAARLEGRVLEGEAGVPGRVTLQLTNAITVLIPTDEDGSFTSPPLPAGPYDATASLDVRDSQGSASFARTRLQLRQGRALQHDFVTDEGAMIIVDVPSAAQRDILTLEYDLFPGKVSFDSFAELKRRRNLDPDIKARWVLFGGVDLDAQMQFHGVKPGVHTVCATAQHEDAARTFACTQAEVAEDSSVVKKLDPVHNAAR